jgi:exonuclease SbcC
MIPQQLEIQGFMSYRDKTVIDFREMDVFVLTGPTGSGKSSLIDAMVCALYGATPRMGGKGLSDLLFQDPSGGVREARIDFSFEHQHQQFRILRSFGTKSGKHQVEAWVRASAHDAWKQLGPFKITEFKPFIEKQLGLSYEAFTRVILLPQGGFDQFIKSDSPANRRKLILEMARLEIYGQIRERAKSHADQLGLEIQNLRGRIESLGNLSPEQAAELRLRLIGLESRISQLKPVLATQQSALTEAREIASLQREQTELSTRQQAHQARQSEMEALRITLRRDQALLQLQPELNQLQKLEQQQAQLTQQHNQLQLRQQQEEQRQQELAREAQALTLAQAEQPALEAHQHQLLALEHQVKGWERQQAELHNLRRERHDSATHLRQTQAEQQRITQQLEPLTQELEQQQATLAAWPDQSARIELLNESLPRLEQIETYARPQLKKLRQELEELEARSEQVRQWLSAHAISLDEKRAALSTQEAEQEQIEARLAQLDREARAALLRHSLMPGEPCPVCLRTLDQLPETPADEDMSHWQARRQHCLEALKTLQYDIQQGEQEHTRQQLQLQNLEQRCANTRQTHQQLKSDSTETIQALKALLGEGIQLESLSRERAELKAAQQQRQQHERQLEQQRQQQQELRNRHELLAERARQQEIIETRLSELYHDKQTAFDQLSNTLSQTLNCTQDFDQVWQAALASVRAQLADLNRRQEYLRTARQQLEQAQTRLNAESEALRQQQQTCETEEAQQRQRLEEALSALDLTLTEARRLRPEAAELQARQQQLETHDREGHLLAAGLETLSQRLAGRSISSEALSAQEQALSDSQQQMTELQREQAVCASQCAQLEAQLERLARERAQMAELEQRKARYDTINSDLRSGQLDDFIYNRIMEQLLEYGSGELEQMSDNRYRFALVDGQLMILDGWNGGEPRNIATLSGGETFLVSLALALALNDYLSRHAQLGSLFIDEGFGTLDPETLEKTAQAIEKLQASGKFIGLITHIPELADRFETRLQVRKSAQGSQLSLL